MHSKLQKAEERAAKEDWIDGQGFSECHIQPDWLLIYLKEDGILTLTLVDTGTHADLFNM